MTESPLEEFVELITHPSAPPNGPLQPRAEPPDLLLNAVTNNNEDELAYALQLAKEEDFRKIRSHPIGNRNILTIACVDPNVSDKVFHKLFHYATEHFGHLDFTEEGWYYWEPIHFAAFHANANKLRSIVSSPNAANKLDVLSILSENALHVLLEYGRRNQSFHVQLSNGWQSRVCHVIAEEKEEVVQCARLLIEKGIDVNHNNIWNESPLIIAIRYRLLQVIELLLRKTDIDLDTCRDPISKKSARDLLRENEIFPHLLTPNTMTVSPAKTLFTYLKNREEEMFLRYNNENIRQYVNHMDGDHDNNTSGGTMLQLCLIKGYIDYEKETSDAKEPQESDILRTPLLQHFCRNGFGRSIEHLLNNGADISRRTRIFGNQDVFQMAVKLSYYPFLAILSEHKSNQITQYHILDVLKNTNDDSFKSKNCNIRHVLFLLTSKLEVLCCSSQHDFIDVDRRKVLNDILDLYLKNNSSCDEYKENICQVLRLGASLTGNGRERLKNISYETLRSHLDECVDAGNGVCYNSLIHDDGGHYSETEALHYLIHDCKKIDLLNHPALVYFIHAKWLKSKKFFYINLAFYTMFLASLYWYMVLLQMNQKNLSVSVIFYILLGMLTLKELVQLVLFFPRYFYDVTNYLEASIIVCCVTNVVSKYEIAMILAILLSTLIFLLMLGQMPKFTKYMIIFSSTKYFLEYASFYFIQFVSFALCFFILLPPKEDESSSTFGAILIKLFDSLIFFIGQYDGDITSPPNFPIFGRIIVAVFIFCMTIILNNLLVGLIVTDMDVIQKTGKQQRQVKMIKYFTRIEKFIRKSDDCFRIFKSVLVDTVVFNQGECKMIQNITKDAGVFDDEDKAYLKEIHESRLQRRNGLSNLYEFIISEIYSEKRGLKDNRDILLKLARLEEQLRRTRAR